MNDSFIFQQYLETSLNFFGIRIVSLIIHSFICIIKHFVFLNPCIHLLRIVFSLNLSKYLQCKKYDTPIRFFLHANFDQYSSFLLCMARLELKLLKWLLDFETVFILKQNLAKEQERYQTGWSGGVKGIFILASFYYLRPN